MEKVNPRALNLDKLSTEKNKTTLGFKCSPKLKLELATEAQKLQITLSEYVESIVSNYKGASCQVNQVNQLENQVNLLQQRLQFYENDILKGLFASNRGKTVDFKTAKGANMTVTINGLQDVYTLLINSFKTSKQ